MSRADYCCVYGHNGATFRLGGLASTEESGLRRCGQPLQNLTAKPNGHHRHSNSSLSWVCSNVRPIRAILRERAGNNGNCISSLFPYVPWGARKKVAIEAGEGSIETTRLGDANTPNPDTSLDRILNFPPLFKAFEEFCRQALCSEASPALPLVGLVSLVLGLL